MLAKKYRLKIQTTLRAGGRVIRGRYCWIKFLPAGAEHPRVGVVIGLRVHKLASRRNVIKRFIYDALAGYVRSGAKFDLILIVQPPARDADKHAIIDELRDLIG